MNTQNTMNEMMTQMMNKMMEACMASMMAQMTNAMSAMFAPTEAEAPAVEEKPSLKATPKLTKEEFLNLSFEKEAKDYSKLDFDVVSTTVCKYNGYVPSDVWTANHIAISQKYGAKWSKKAGGYKFETAAAMQNFLRSYQIKTELTDVDRHNIKLYKQERAKAQAEYYAKKAQE